MRLRTNVLRMARLRPAMRSQAGMSLVEVMVTAFILGIVMTAFLSVMASVQSGVARQDHQGRTNDAARLALQQLDREIRSGNVLYDPASESPASYRLRVYTQTNADTRGSYYCELWEITTDDELRFRSWPPLTPEDATGWRVVAEGIVNRSVSPAVPAFALDPDPNKGGRVIDITLMVNDSLAARPDSTIRLQASITGRNTSYGYPQDVCGTLPT